MISGNLSSARLENDDSKRKRPCPSGSSSTALGSAKENSSKKRRNASSSIAKKSQQMLPSNSLSRISEILRKRTPRPLKRLMWFQKGGTSPSSKRQGASSSGKSYATCTRSKTHGTESMRKEEKKKKKMLMVEETESRENSKVDVASSRGKKSAISAHAYMACFIEQRKRINLASLEDLICPWEQPDSIQKIQNSCELLSKAVDNEKNTQSSNDSNHDNQESGSGDVDGTADISKLVEPVLSNAKPVDAVLTYTPEQEEDISEIRGGTYGNPNRDSREHFEGSSFDQAGEKILWTASGELETVAWTENDKAYNNGKGLESGDNDRAGGREQLLREEKFSRFVEYWVPAQISNVQLEQYCEMLLSNAVLLCSSSRSGPVAALRDILINAHKCCNHPYIADPNLPSLLSRHVQATEYLDVGIKASGKLVLLDNVLQALRKQKMRVLILFQSIRCCMNSTGDILDDYVRQRFGADSYERVDGGIVSSRILAALNKFNQIDQGRFVFLLENRACHHRIVLTSVDVVIIFDSDWNSINDLRNLQKISLKSEHEQVRVFRLYTSFTVEEKVLVCAKHGATWNSKLLSVSSSTSQMLLMWGASYLMKKLEEFHNSSNMYISESDQRLTENVAQEFLTLLHLGKEKSVKSSCLITKAQVGLAGYGTDSLLCGEVTLQFEPKELPHIFWSRLLAGKVPCWKYVCLSSQRSRKRVKLNDQIKDDSGNAQKKQHRTLSTKMPGPLEPKGNGISQDYEALKESLEKAYRTAVAIVRLHHIGSKKTEKLEIMKEEHANRLKELELAHLTAKNRIPHGTKSFSVQGDRNSFEGIAHLKETADEIDYVPCQSTDPDAGINVHDVENGDPEGTSNTTKAPGSKSSSKEASLQPEADNETAYSISASRIAEFAQEELLCHTGSMINHQGDVRYGNTCPGEVASDKEMIGGAEKETLPGSGIPAFTMQNVESIPPDDLLMPHTSIDGGGRNQEQRDNLLESEVQAPNPYNSTSSDMEERNGLPPEPQNTMQQRELEERDSRNGKLSDRTKAWMEPVVQPQVSGNVSPPTASLDSAVENQLLGDVVTCQQMLTGMQATGGSLMPPAQTRSRPLTHSASGALGSSGDPLSSLLGPRSLPSQPFIQGSLGMRFTRKSDPLEMELEKTRKEEEHADRTYYDLTLRLKSECEREIQEAVAQIRMKFDCKFKEAEADYSLKKNGLDLNMYRVYMNKMLAQDFRRTWVDVKASGLQGRQTAQGFRRQSVPGVHGLPSNSSRVHAATLSRLLGIPPVRSNSHKLFQATPPINSVLPQSSSVAPGSLMDPASLSSNSRAPNLATAMLVGHPITAEQVHALAPAPHLRRFRPPPVGPTSPNPLPKSNRQHFFVPSISHTQPGTSISSCDDLG